MTETTRRTVMLGAGGAGLAAVLTACASYGSPTTQASEAPAAEEESAAPKKKIAKKQAKALADTADIQVGGGTVVKSQKIVVTQPTEGEFKAFTAICTHAGCTVADVSDGTINCPCHGSKFKIEDGSVADGPAPSPLAEKKIKVEDGKIRLA